MQTTTVKTNITVSSTINAPVEYVWNLWTDPKHIIRWNTASEDWHSPKAENDLSVGGRFNTRMEAWDGSSGFDFSGVYSKVELCKLIEYTLDDNRKVRISFDSSENETTVTETFEAEQTYEVEFQKGGWQAILDNFKKYVETSGNMENLHFEISINASVEKVYNIMLDEKHYSEWTAEFSPTSHYLGSWEKGAKIVFLGEDQDGNQGGMVSRIRNIIPNKYVSIEHLGIVKDGKEIMEGPEVEPWAGALENYTFIDQNGKTLLLIDMESNKQSMTEFKAYFQETWPKALITLKSICEK